MVYPNFVEKMLNNASLDITLSVSANLMHGELKNPTSTSKDEKNSSTLLSMLTHPILSKSLRILTVPYDMVSYLETQNLNNVTQNIG